MFKQFQAVELTHKMMSDRTLGERVLLKKGLHGVILEIYTRPGIPNGYDVEFFDNAHNTVAVTVVGEKDIKPRKTPPTGVKSINSRLNKRKSDPRVA